jgi:hypothetical protein
MLVAFGSGGYNPSIPDLQLAGRKQTMRSRSAWIVMEPRFQCHCAGARDGMVVWNGCGGVELPALAGD